MKPKYLLLLMSTILLHGIVTAQNSVSENEARMPLGEVEEYIGEHGHLPQMPLAAEVAADGADLGEMNRLLLRKVEELTLYIIDLQKQIYELKSNN